MKQETNIDIPIRWAILRPEFVCTIDVSCSCCKETLLIRQINQVRHYRCVNPHCENYNRVIKP